MQLKLVKSFWGMEGSLAGKMALMAEAGFSACEGSFIALESQTEFLSLRRQYNLDFVAMVFTEGPDHLVDFGSKVERALRFEPMQITAHSGLDSWTLDEKKRFFEGAIEIERRFGVPINHETHRSRALFTPWDTAALLAEFPALHIVADFSHWVNVCERLLDDQAANVAAAARRARHIHGRIGYEQGPQVNDPRAPEWSSHLAVHETWWRMIIESRAKERALFLTFNPEFGPPTYLQTLPYSQEPVADLWEICVWMAKRFSEFYADCLAGS